MKLEKMLNGNRIELKYSEGHESHINKIKMKLE